MAKSIALLHVEDDLDFADLAKTHFERQSTPFNVEIAATAEEALEILETTEIDCVVSDYDLPETNGLELLETIRSDAPALPVIFFTGKGSERIASEAINAGVTDYVQKESVPEQFELLANRIEQAVERRWAQENYREIFEKIPDGVTIHDASDGTIVDTNDRFCEMLGYTREELLELDFAALHPGEKPYTAERAENYIQRAAREGPQTFEWVDETKSGERLPVEITLRNTTINGNPRILAVVRDISERRAREREQERRQHELERKTERLDRFASYVSHDLRTPVSVAQGRLELAREETDSQHLGAVAEALERIDAMIEDLLELSREGESVGSVEPVALDELAATCCQNVASDELTYDINMNRTVRADSGRLKQLLENLLRNAVEHGGPNVKVEIGPLANGFYVEDDGPGIPQREREDIFEPGYSTAAEGTGFGLAIGQEIVNAHGWDIAITESDDGGARFEITGVESLD